MGWHIIRAFGCVLVVWHIFWHHVIKMAFKILPHSTVSIFIDAEAGRGMLNKNMQHALLQVLQLGEFLFYDRGDEVETPLKCW